MSDPVRAVGKLNEALHPGERLLVTSRAAMFESSVRPPGDVEVTLRAAAGIMLRPLRAADVAGFLRDAAGGPQAQTRWTKVIALLGSDVPVARVLSNPLMVSLASAIYNPSPDEATDSGPGEPDDLSKLAGEEAIQRRLFDGFIRAAYRTRRADRRSRGWSARQAQPWFSFLAARLERVKKPDLAWWELVDAAPVSVMSLACGLVTGITFGLTAFLVAGLGSAVAAGLGGGLAAWLTLYTYQAGAAAGGFGAVGCWIILYIIVLGGAFVLMVVLTALLATVHVVASVVAGIIAGVVAGNAAFNMSALQPASAARWRPRWAALLAGLVFGITGGVIVGLTAGISSGLAGGLAAGLAALVAVGWKGGPGNPYKVPTPAVALARDRAAAIGPTLSYAVAAGLPAGLSAELSHDPPFGLPHGLAAGLVLAIAAGLPFGLYFGSAAVQAEWRDWVLARVYLALRGQMPWRPMAFLSDAHARGVLRQAGAFYQFRHIELQRQLARRKAAMSPPADNDNEPIWL